MLEYGLVNLVLSRTPIVYGKHKQLIDSTVAKYRSGIRGGVWPDWPYITKII